MHCRTAGDCARAEDRPPNMVPDGVEGSNVSGLQSFEVEGAPTSASSHTGLLTAPRFFSMTRGSTQKRLLHAQSELSTDGDGEDDNETMKEVNSLHMPCRIRSSSFWAAFKTMQGVGFSLADRYASSTAHVIDT